MGWAFASALLHGAVVAGLLIWPDRTTPPLPPEEIGVALIFADAETGAPTTNLPDAPPGEAAMAAAQPPTNTPSTALPDPSSVPEDARAPAEHRSDDSAAARDLAGQVALPAAAAELPNLPLPPPAPPPSAATSAMANLPLPPPAPQPPPVRLAARAPVADRPAGGAAARLEDGGRATGAVVPASIATGADNRPPEYPFDSRRKGEEGVVGLRVHVAEDGSVVDVELAQSSGFPLLDDAAERAVRSWRFRPALRDGVPVRSTLRTAVQFRLQDAR